ncbi:Gar1/Naf1 RNA binding region-domain-containing protein [Phyllosticta capitalensis]|uniref:H/ACA ribonucleoprotein complex non-core subunit NAF1 n=2 Tax=Phyllosticta capitalensis TaxID=121624 RepID=A0ABR1YFV4_9PEZI
MAFSGIPGLGLLSNDATQPVVNQGSSSMQGVEEQKPAPVAATVDTTATEKPENVNHIEQKLEESSLHASDSIPVEGHSDHAQTASKEQEDTPMANGDASQATAPEQSAPTHQEPQAKAPVDSEFIEAAEANKNNPAAEWQYDSSDAESSSDSDTSSDSSSDDESEDEGDYPLLDPMEQARILMQEEYGDDDGGKASASQLRTANEVAEDKIEKPDVTIGPDMKITDLGKVDSIVDNMILIRANVSGEYQVLESGSVLCTEDRAVIGAVADTLGRVQEPLYTVAFNDRSEIEAAGLSKGSTVYYVDQHSTYVFTEPLKNLKGTDASNQFDEEVAENELEFSDDEAEAEHKRKQKQAKREKAGHGAASKPSQPSQPEGYTGALSYDDDGTDLYTPLARPDGLHHMGSSATVEEHPRSRRGHGHRGRGGRGAARGGRGGAAPPLVQNEQPQIQQQPQQSFPSYHASQNFPFQFGQTQAPAWPQSNAPFAFGANNQGGIPAGAFVNPAFFQGQQQQQPYGQQQPAFIPPPPPQFGGDPQQAAEAFRVIQAMAAASQQQNSAQPQGQSQQQSQQPQMNQGDFLQAMLRNLQNGGSNGQS